MTASPRLAVIAGVGVFLVGAAVSPAPSLLLAQQPANATGTAVISGVAIDGTTKTPVPGAAMSLVRDTSDGIRMAGREILADAQGRFVFTGLPDGGFRLTARGTGASFGAYGFERSRPQDNVPVVGLILPSVPFNLEVKPGQRVIASVSIWRDPVISGHVVSVRGEPVRDALVRLVQWRMVAGHRTLGGTLTTTDDQGTFSVRVSPGEYMLLATADDVVVRGVKDNSRGQQFGYLQSFYPSSPTPDGASTISVAAGDVRNGLVIQMPLVRTYRVRGTLRSQDGPLPNRISLASADSQADDLTSRRATAVGADGRFAFDNVAPGRYVLASLTSGLVSQGRAGTPPANTWVNATIDVTTTDVEVTADVHRAVHLTGRVMFDGSGAPPDFLSSSVTIERDTQAGEPTDVFIAPPRSVDADGRFSLDVLPGRFVIQGSVTRGGPRGAGPGWTVRSAMSGKQDLADAPFTPVQDVSNVLVTFTDRAAEVRGRVVNTDREAAVVVVFPADDRFWNDYIVRRKRVMRPGADGTFRATDLPAGDYYVSAVRGLSESDVRSGAYYASLATQARRISLVEGDVETLDVPAVPAPPARAAMLAPPPRAVEAADVADVRAASATPAGGGSISGRVIDATTKQPVASMRLSLAPTLDDSVYTDDDGDFLFEAVTAGPHLIYTRHPLYAPTIYGARRPDEPGTPITVAAGQHVTGLTFPITRGASISGTLLDYNGEPLPDVTMNVRQYRWQPTGRELVTVRTLAQLGLSRTDPQGRFRIAGLAPGDYIVTANVQTTSRPLTLTSAADVAFANAKPDARVRLPEAITGVITAATYPNAFDVARGNSLRLRVGEERNITLQTNLVSGNSVSGFVHGPDGSPMGNVSVQLVANDPLATTTASRFGTSDATGAFTMTGVPPGSYTLVSRGVPLVRVDATALARGSAALTPQRQPLSTVPLDVQIDGDVGGLVLTMGPTRTLTGRIHTDASDAPPPTNNIRLMASRMGAPAGTANTTTTANWTPDGAFTFSDLAPGRYRLSFTGPRNTVLPRWIAQTVDGTNAIDRGIEIGSTGAPSGVDLVMSTTTSQFAGMLESKAGKTDGVFVVLFAAQPEAWTPPSLRIFATQPDQTGRFTFANVPPGNYRIAPVTDAEPNQWFDPAYLATLADHSTPVSISVESTETIRLTMP
jgi:hypothetical protein